MKAICRIAFVIVGAAAWFAGASAWGQIVINEMVDDERTPGSGQVRPDTREFVELYNAGASAVDISGWNLNVIQIGLIPAAPATSTYSIPANTPAIPAGDYFVIAKTGSTVANVDLFVTAQIPNGSGFELFPEDAAGGGSNTPTANFVLELRNGSTLVDALATETFRDPERSTLTAEQLAKVGGGWWGQTISCNAGTDNPVPQSLARYQDGVTRNRNGYDFGMLPATPGTTNNLAQHQSHTIPNVDAMSTGTALTTDYYASFVVPKVIDPTVPDAQNPTSISASPQGGLAIMSYDNTGGGNASYSKELVNKFALYAYIETSALNLVSDTVAQVSEASIYGIGTTDAFFGTPNGAGLLLTLTSTQNNSTGYGWVIQRVENYNAGVPATTTLLQLVDFDDGGDSLPGFNEWQVMKSYDLSTSASGWHRLSIEYDPATGIVTGKNDGATTVFTEAGDFNNDGKVDAADYVVWRKNEGTTNVMPNDGIGGTIGQAQYNKWRAQFGHSKTPGLVGNFYVGYRENLTAQFATSRPPTYDMIGEPGAGAGVVPEPSAIGLALVGMACGWCGRRRGVR